MSRGLVLAVLFSPAAAVEPQDAVDDGLELSRRLSRLEDQTEQNPGEASLWLELSRVYRLVADDWAAAGSSPRAPLEDARRALERALELDPDNAEAAREAYYVVFDLGDYPAAVDLSMREMGRSMVRSGRVSGDLWERAARARIEAFLPTLQGELDEAGLADVVRTLENAAAAAPGHAGLYSAAGRFFQFLQAPAHAAKWFLAGLTRAPSRVDLHQGLIDTCFFQRVVERLPEFYRDLAARYPENAAVAWYQGYVELLMGDQERRELEFQAARNHYRNSRQLLRRASRLEPQFRDGAARIGLLAWCGEGWCHLREGNLDAAGEAFTRLLAGGPDLRELRGGLGRTLMEGISALGSEYERRGDFGGGSALIEKVVEVEPDNGGWWNNLGYFLRELGTGIEAGWVPVEGDRAVAARATFEKSWNAYQRAAELSPDDARVVNDAALIQVYHLQTDLELAESMLWQAIRTGEEQLAAMGDDPPETERFPIAQAVGDAYENLGYMDYHFRDRWPKAREFFLQSIATNSGERFFQNYIDSIDGAGERVEIRGAVGSGPVETPPGQVDWQPSFDAALSLAGAEGRTLLVYYRGDALGLSIPVLDRWVTSRSFEDRVAEAVVVVADPSRTTFTDRRRDGTRLPSPKYGVVTCGEHVQAAEEFQRWWLEQRLDPDSGSDELTDLQWTDAPAEGIHAIAPGGKYAGMFGLGSRRGYRALLARSARDATGGVLDLGRVQRDLGSTRPELRRVAARQLVGAKHLPAVQMLESLLFDPARPSSVRAALVAEILAADAEGELATALVDQLVDTELCRLALDQWPATNSADPVLRAFHWSPGSRAAAARALRRRGEDEARPVRIAAILESPGEGDE